MSDDIVTRLRAWSDNAKEQDATEIVVGLCQAADEIERLRKERDEARQLYCERLLEISRQQDCNAKWFADEMGWDCYKEEP